MYRYYVKRNTVQIIKILLVYNSTHVVNMYSAVLPFTAVPGTTAVYTSIIYRVALLVKIHDVQFLVATY